MTFELTTKAFWDKMWSNTSAKKFDFKDKYYIYELEGMLKKILPENASFLEVGCAASGWLPYFYNNFGYEVWGIDYFLKGCFLAKKNLELNSAKGNIICGDIFEHPLKYEKFDVVFSSGLIEHFTKPDLVLEELISFLKPGGTLITLIPNLNGLNGLIARMTDKVSFVKHNIIDKAGLRYLYNSAKLQRVSVEYIGVYGIHGIGCGVNKHAKSFLLFMRDSANYCLTSIFKGLRLSCNFKFLSPMIVAIGEKGQ